MRRALVSMVPQGGAPFTMGDAATSRGFGATSGTLWVNRDNPAPHAGTVTSVQLYVTSAGPFTLVTGDLSGTTFTVTSAANVTAGATGVNTFGVSLPVNTGGFVGFWSGSAAGSRASTGGSNLTIAAGAAPGAGSVYTGVSTTGTNLLSIQGTGS